MVNIENIYAEIVIQNFYVIIKKLKHTVQNVKGKEFAYTTRLKHTVKNVRDLRYAYTTR
jgi:hypothetical protein